MAKINMNEIIIAKIKTVKIVMTKLTMWLNFKWII